MPTGFTLLRTRALLTQLNSRYTRRLSTFAPNNAKLPDLIKGHWPGKRRITWATRSYATPKLRYGVPHGPQLSAQLRCQQCRARRRRLKFTPLHPLAEISCSESSSGLPFNSDWRESEFFTDDESDSCCLDWYQLFLDESLDSKPLKRNLF